MRTVSTVEKVCLSEEASVIHHELLVRLAYLKAFLLAQYSRFIHAMLLCDRDSVTAVHHKSVIVIVYCKFNGRMPFVS